MSQRRRDSHTFARVPSVNRQRSQFDRSHGYKTTFDSGYLIPFFVDEVVPGDHHRLNSNMFARLATLQKPIMDNLYLETFFFFVPFRLLWTNWQKMWGEQENPGDSTDYLVPQVVAPPGASVTVGSIWDYFGIPVGVQDLAMSALYPRAYNLIWNEWFRDQNLQDSVPIVKGDTDDPANYTLLRRGKRHDYFTSCLPFPQKGPEVFLPVGGASVIPLESGDAGYVDGSPHFSVANGGSPTTGFLQGTTTGAFSDVQYSNAITLGDKLGWDDTQLKVGESATSATINDFRQAVVIQQFYEMLARGGSRYVELLQSVYGVTNGDARLQRPEYLGGGRTNIMVNPVVNTAGVAGGNSQADLAGYAVGSGSGGHGFSKAFTEHGVVMGLCCVRADLNYQQGIHRQYHRRTKFDFLIPHFANLGEQAVLNQEIYAQGSAVLNPSGDPVDEDVFGYVSRYDDYRYKPSLITGVFRSQAATSLDMWHLAQDFASLPTLSPTFIEENPPVDRIITVPTEPQFLLDTWNQLQSVRELPVYSVPGLTRI